MNFASRFSSTPDCLDELSSTGDVVSDAAPRMHDVTAIHRVTTMNVAQVSALMRQFFSGDMGLGMHLKPIPQTVAFALIESVQSAMWEHNVRILPSTAPQHLVHYIPPAYRDDYIRWQIACMVNLWSPIEH